jgi:hypothetical protein
LKSYRDAAAVRSIPNAIYYAEHHDIIEQIFNRDGVLALVACNAEDPEQICGYSVASVSAEGVLIIHWIYSKFPFRRIGIAKALEAKMRELVPSEVVYYTHAGKGIERLLNGRKYIFNPYLLGAK